jgi:hypothetical protein
MAHFGRRVKSDFRPELHELSPTRFRAAVTMEISRLRSGCICYGNIHVPKGRWKPTVFSPSSFQDGSAWDCRPGTLYRANFPCRLAA